MKKIALVLIGLILVGVSAFAEGEAKKDVPDTIFQRSSDVINGKYVAEIKPLKEITVFQSMADWIGESSRKAMSAPQAKR